MTDRYEVIVGNVGCIYRGDDKGAACSLFLDYKQASIDRLGRVDGESVTLFQDGEILDEYAGTLDD